MVTLRTAEQVLEEYEAVRAAYLRALNQTQGSQTTGAGSVSFTRANPDVLREQLRSLDAEYRNITGNGIRVVGVVPSD